MRNRIVRNGAVVDQTKIELFGDNNHIEWAPDASMLKCRVVVLGSNNEVKFGPKARIGNSTFWIHGSDSKVCIETEVSVNESEIILTEDRSRIRIGAGTMLGPQCAIRCGDGHAIFEKETGEILNRAISIELEENVLVGTRAQILKNVRIGMGSIIGACAVVTNDVPSGCIATGVPAKVIRSGVTWTRQRIDDLPAGWNHAPDSSAVSK